MGHIYFDKKWPTYYKNKIGHLLYVFMVRPFFSGGTCPVFSFLEN